jgi:hypothetical protein
METLNNQIGHILIDRRMHSSVLDVRSFRAESCDADDFQMGKTFKGRD